jgi:Rieske Fe-S protein
VEKKVISRRDFLKNAGTLGLSVCVAGALATSCEQFTALEDSSTGVTINLDMKDRAQLPQSDYDLLQRINYGVLKRYPKVNYGVPVCILRLTKQGEFAVYSTMCTHAHCLMKNPDTELPSGDYRGQTGLEDYTYFNCHCHGSQFNPFEDGRRIAGPAEKPLKKFPCSYDPQTEILTINF